MSIMFPAWLAIGAILAIGGITAWVIQARRGLAVTSLTNLSPWGFYISGFIFFMGLSVGSFILASLPVLFGLDAIRPYAGIAALVAVSALIVGALFIFVDIGKPSRVWRMFRSPNFKSPMIWDLALTVVYFLVGALLLVVLLVDAPAGLQTTVAVLALVVGVAEGVTAFVFATTIARDFWYSAVQPMAFLTAAIASAGAVLILLALGLQPSGYVKLTIQELEPLALLVAGTLLLGMLLLASEVISMAANKSPKSARIVRAVVGSPIFWFEIATALLAAIILVIPGVRVSSAGMAIGSALALIHLALKRIHFVHMGFKVPNIEASGVDIDRNRHHSGVKPVEIALVVGLIGGFIVLLCIGLTILPLGA